MQSVSECPVAIDLGYPPLPNEFLVDIVFFFRVVDHYLPLHECLFFQNRIACIQVAPRKSPKHRKIPHLPICSAAVSNGLSGFHVDTIRTVIVAVVVESLVVPSGENSQIVLQCG